MCFSDVANCDDTRTHLREPPGVGFLLPAFRLVPICRKYQESCVKPPFDIAADLDTPVSAYLKLKPFRPRFLLESVEGGERLARYSFIGFGDCLEVRLDAKGLKVGTQLLPVPRTQQELLQGLRGALAQAPQPLPEIPGVPLSGGLVG